MSISVFAPAKINLFLHVTERLPNGYHNLDSLIAFADIGDEITLEPFDHFSFEITGPFAGAFSGKDWDASPASTNLVARAAWAMARESEHQLDMKITLKKNLPLGAGIGGGSADAAALIRALLQYWNMPADLPFLKTIMITLGADVPVCFQSQPVRVRGIGDVFDHVDALPEIPVVLCYPGKPCSTPEVFRAFSGSLTPLTTLASVQDKEQLLDVLKTTHNDLELPAQKIVPEIENVLKALNMESSCLLARMSGSGSCCFGLFDDHASARISAQKIAASNPDWWVTSGTINPTP